MKLNLIFFGCLASICHGNQDPFLHLNSLTFNKTLQAYSFSFVKFDSSNPKRHEAFEKLSFDLMENSKILMAEVRITGFGSPLNLDLAKRFNLTQGMLPELIFFRKRRLKGKKFDYETTRYGGEMSLEHFKKFLKRKSGIWLGLPGCIEEFDALADEFMENSDQLPNLNDILEKVEKMVTNLPDEKVISGEKYLKFMKLIISKGKGFISSEEERLTKLLADSNLRQEKSQDLTKTLNILRSFQLTKRIKDEL